METSLKAEILQTVSEIKSQVSALETWVSKKCLLSEMCSKVQTVVLQETTSIKANLTQHLDSEIQRHFSEERDRQYRALNIVAFVVPLQPNDQLFIKSYIDWKYKLRDVHINNVGRLPILLTLCHLHTLSCSFCCPKPGHRKVNHQLLPQAPQGYTILWWCIQDRENQEKGLSWRVEKDNKLRWA